MKCPTCGANLQIEDEICPFCQNPNPFAVKHRQDMQYYHQEFQETKQNVEEKARRFHSLTAKITVIAVLFAMVVGMIYIGSEGPYRIWASGVRKEIARNVGDYRAKLDAYEQEGDWLSLYAFYDARNLTYYSEEFREYSILYFMIFEYRCTLNVIFRYRAEPERYSTAERATLIASHLDSFYRSVERIGYESDYYDINYTPEHQDAYARIREDMEAVLTAYCDLTEEEILLLPEYSISKKAVLIEEGLLRQEAERKKAEQ